MYEGLDLNHPVSLILILQFIHFFIFKSNFFRQYQFINAYSLQVLKVLESVFQTKLIFHLAP